MTEMKLDSSSNSIAHFELGDLMEELFTGG